MLPRRRYAPLIGVFPRAIKRAWRIWAFEWEVCLSALVVFVNPKAIMKVDLAPVNESDRSMKDDEIKDRPVGAWSRARSTHLLERTLATST